MRWCTGVHVFLDLLTTVLEKKNFTLSESRRIISASEWVSPNRVNALHVPCTCTCACACADSKAMYNTCSTVIACALLLASFPAGVIHCSRIIIIGHAREVATDALLLQRVYDIVFGCVLHTLSSDIAKHDEVRSNNNGKYSLQVVYQWLRRYQWLYNSQYTIIHAVRTSK